MMELCRPEKEQYAMRYVIEKDFAVIPTTAQKVPLIQKWNSGNAATDYPTVVRYWSKWKDADIGIVTGRQSNLAVIDIDNADSIAPTMQIITEQCGLSEDELVIADTQRGIHIYFSHDYSNCPLPRTTNCLEAEFGIRGVDLIAENSFVAAPCSTGKTWRNSIFDTYLPSLPALFQNLVPAISLPEGASATGSIGSNGSHVEPQTLVTHTIMCNTGSLQVQSSTEHFQALKSRLLALMQKPIPPGMSHTYYLRHGIPILTLFTNGEALLTKWFAMKSDVLSDERVQDRLKRLRDYVRCTRGQLERNEVSPTVPRFRPADECSDQLEQHLGKLLSDGSVSQKSRDRAAMLAVYMLNCARVTKNLQFFRSYRDIIRDVPEVFEGLQEASKLTTLSRLLGLIVDGYLVDRKTGEVSNHVPIFRCINHGQQYQEGEKPSGIAGEYVLNRDYDYLLEL